MINLRTATDADPATPGQTVIASADDESPCGHVKGDRAHGLDCATVAEWDAASAEYRRAEAVALDRTVQIVAGFDPDQLGEALRRAALVDLVIDEALDDNDAPITSDDLCDLALSLTSAAHLLDDLVAWSVQTAHTLPSGAQRDDLGAIADNLARAWALVIAARRDVRTMTRVRS